MADYGKIPFAEAVDPFNTGFVPFTNPSVPEPRWQITGDDCQCVTILLDPQESLYAEPGSMMFMSPSIETDVHCQCAEGITRKCAGEPFVKVELKNGGNDAAYVGLTPNFPAKVVPIELDQVGGRIIGKSGAIMSSLGDATISLSCDTNPLTACFSGLGCLRQVISGHGTAFIAAGGTILTKQLKDGETLIVDSDSLVAFSDTVAFGVRPNMPCTFCCGGEGLCNTTITGPGLVITQSMSFPKFVRVVAPPPGAGMQRGGGSNAIGES